jgi:chromosome segregation ATPase
MKQSTASIRGDGFVSLNSTEEREKQMDKQKTHMGKMEEQMNQWGATLDDLVAKASEAEKKVKSDYHLGIEELKAKYSEMQSKLKNLKDAEGDKWDDFKTGIDKSWAELESAFNKLTN